MRLLTRTNAKTPKGEALGYITWILYLAPADLSGYEVCGGRSPGCTNDCLYKAGRGQMKSVQKARIQKTKLFFEHREMFMEQLAHETELAIAYAKRKGMKAVFRLNGTSDIPWETIRCRGKRNIFEVFPDQEWYDYTKLLGRKKIPKNYHLTFSRSEANDHQIADAFKHGMNVAVVFHHKPTLYLGFPTLDGDQHDLRFLDPENHIVALSAKGLAKKSHTNFVI
jgi:hypothetical protein